MQSIQTFKALECYLQLRILKRKLVTQNTLLVLAITQPSGDYTHKCIVEKVYRYLYVKVLVEVKVNLREKEQISKTFQKNEELETP